MSKFITIAKQTGEDDSYLSTDIMINSDIIFSIEIITIRTEVKRRRKQKDGKTKTAMEVEKRHLLEFTLKNGDKLIEDFGIDRYWNIYKRFQELQLLLR